MIASKFFVQNGFSRVDWLAFALKSLGGCEMLRYVIAVYLLRAALMILCAKCRRIAPVPMHRVSRLRSDGAS